MAKKIEVFLSEYEYLQETLKAYAFTIASLEAENMRLKKELELLKCGGSE